MTINPIGGSGGGFDPERRKTPPERAEEAAGHLRERIRNQQAGFKERLHKRAEEAAPPPRPRSLDTGTEFDRADFPEMPAPKDGRGDGFDDVG